MTMKDAIRTPWRRLGFASVADLAGLSDFEPHPLATEEMPTLRLEQ
jgi:hypothetical protein